MYDLEIRQASRGEIDKLVAYRLRQLADEGAAATCDLTPSLQAYYQTHIEEESFLIYVGVLHGEIVATGALTLTHKPPYYENKTGKIGIVSNVYTENNFRRQGIATAVVKHIIQEAERRGCGELQINASVEGRPIYEKVGFKAKNNFLRLVPYTNEGKVSYK